MIICLACMVLIVQLFCLCNQAHRMVSVNEGPCNSSSHGHCLGETKRSPLHNITPSDQCLGVTLTTFLGGKFKQ